ncbi:unnamed protein product [Anisakis simplex]|uniref:HRDC domain-containing protein n=1 Tax=Anisakis simplex TaxID=6269 RepID=A0A3P6PVB1_ANISI|nr:unnamed protein product [Anisakis simplex]
MLRTEHRAELELQLLERLNLEIYPNNHRLCFRSWHIISVFHPLSNNNHSQHKTKQLPLVRRLRDNEPKISRAIQRIRQALQRIAHNNKETQPLRVLSHHSFRRLALFFPKNRDE